MFQGESNPYSEVSQGTEVPPNNEGEEAACTSSDCQSNQSESSTDSRGRLSLLETELQARTRDLDRLKFKIDKMKSHQMSSPATSRREAKPINIKIEVERLRKDKKVMAELLKQSQQELTRKDSINRKLKSENDKISRNMSALQGKLAENGRTQNLLEELNRVRNELSVLTSKTGRLTPAYQGQASNKDDKGRYIEELVIEKEQLKQCLSAIYFKITPFAVSLPSRSATPPVWTEDVKNTFDQFWEEKVKLQRELEELRERVKSRESAEQNRTSPECYETTVSDCSTDSKSDYLSDATIVKVSRPTGHHDLESEVCRWKEMYQNVYDKYRSSQHTISYHEKKFKKIYSVMEELAKNVYGEEHFAESVSGYNITKVIQKLSDEYALLKESFKKVKYEEQHQTDLQNSILEAEKILEEKGRNARTLRNAIGTLQLTSNMETKVASLAETMLLIYNNQLNWLKQLEHNNTLPNSEGEETHSNSPNQCDLDLPMQDDDKVDNRLNCGDAMSCSSESNESSTCEAQEVIHKAAASDLNVECCLDQTLRNDNQTEANEKLNTEKDTEFVQVNETCKNQENQDEVKIENAVATSGENEESHAKDETQTEDTSENVENEGGKEEKENVEEEPNKSEKENLDNSESAVKEISSEAQTETNVEDENQTDLENESSQKVQESEPNAEEEEKETKDGEASEVEATEEQENEKDNAEENGKDNAEENEKDNAGENEEKDEKKEKDTEETKNDEKDAEENEEEDEKKEKDSEEAKNDEKHAKDEDDDDDDKEQNNSNADEEENTEEGKDDTEKTAKDEESKEEESEKKEDKGEDAKQEKETEDQIKSLPLEQNENDETTEIDESCGNDEKSETTDTTEDKENTANETEKETNDAEDNETDSKIELEQNIEINKEEKLVTEKPIDPKSSEDLQSRLESENAKENESEIAKSSEEANETAACPEEGITTEDKSSLNSEMKDKEINSSLSDDPGPKSNDNEEHCVQNHLVQSVVAEVHNSAETQEYITENANSAIEPECENDRISTIPEADEENEGGDDTKDSAKDNEETSEANDQSEGIINTTEGNDLNAPDNSECADGAINDSENTSVSLKASEGEDGDHETIQHASLEKSDEQIVITETEETNYEESPCSSVSHSLSTSENKDNIKIIINPASSEEHESVSEEITQSSANNDQENADEIKDSLEKTEDKDESHENDEQTAKDEAELAPVIEQEITKVVIEPKKNVFFTTMSVLEKDAADDNTKCEESSKQYSNDSLNKRIEELETEMSEMLEVKRHHMKVACDLAEKLEAMKKRELDLQDQLSSAETKSSQEVEGLWKEWSGREQSYQDEIAAWKENVEQQNSVLQRLKSDLDQAQQMAQLKEDEMEQLRSTEKEKRPETQLERETQTSDQEEDPNSKELQETVDRLRITSEHYQQQLMENRTVVREVKSIIEGSVAQLVTLKAMGTKHMKREYVYRNNLAQKELDLKHLQTELDKQSIDARAKANIIEKQRNEIRSLREELRKCQKDISAKVEFIGELQGKMQHLISSDSKPSSSNPEDLEMYIIGRRCIDEQHAITLEKQKEELERMRQELHLLELKCSDIDSAAESSDQQNVSQPGSAGSVRSVSEEYLTGGNLCLCKRKDVNKILKLSEESYLNLLASLVVCLGIQDMKYNKSLQRLSWSQCKDISAERKANQKKIMKVIQDLKKEERTVSPRIHQPERSRSTGETEKRRGLVKCISPQNGRSMYISDMIRQAEENLDKDKPIKTDGRKPTSWRPHTSMNDRRIPLELKNGEILALLGNAEPKSVPKPALSSK